MVVSGGWSHHRSSRHAPQDRLKASHRHHVTLTTDEGQTLDLDLHLPVAVATAAKEAARRMRWLKPTLSFQAL